VIDDPITYEDEITELVEAGFIVRTRADVDYSPYVTFFFFPFF
jgi:hypothetical protein